MLKCLSSRRRRSNLQRQQSSYVTTHIRIKTEAAKDDGNERDGDLF